MRPKTSDIWQYFLAIDDDFAKCKICGNKYSRRGRTTTSLRAHLKAIHKEIYEENTNAEQSQKVTLAQLSSMANITQLQRAERQLFLAESWHKEKYEELCKIQEQQEELRLGQQWSDRTPLQRAFGEKLLGESIHNRTYCEQLCKIEVKKENGELEQPSLDVSSATLQQAKRQQEHSSSPKEEKMDDMIGEMIALQNLPFHFVDGVGFRRVMETALPNYQLRGRQFFTNHVCYTIYHKVVNKVGRMLQKCSKLSFTVDIRSEPNSNRSLLNLTAHGISEDFDRVKIVLKSCLFQGQTGDKICENLKLMQRDWNIADDNLHCLVRDGSNTLKSMHLASIPNVNCPIHQLQLCLRSTLETLELKNFVAKCREISGHFIHSETAQDELARIQTQLNQPILRVIHDDNNRLSSTLLSLEWLLNIEEALCLYANNHNIPQISPEESVLLNNIIAILNPFVEVTRILGDAKTCISSVIPLIYVLKQTLLIEMDKTDIDENFKSIIKRVVEDINIRFGDLPSNTLYSVATYLDPRYKLKFFNDIVKEQVQTKLLCLLAENDIKTANNTDEGQPPACKKSRTASYQMNPGISLQLSPTQSVHSNLADILNSSDDDEHSEDTGMDKKYIQWKLLINEYNKEKRLQVDEDPLVWWRQNAKYKDLVPVIRDYLSPPASSESEQLLNEEGPMEPLGDELADDTAARLFVKYNLPLINFDY